MSQLKKKSLVWSLRIYKLKLDL